MAQKPIKSTKKTQSKTKQSSSKPASLKSKISKKVASAKSAKKLNKGLTLPSSIVVHTDEGELFTRRIAELMLSKKATDITIMDVRGLTDMTDFFTICSADSDKQVKAISDAIRDGLLLDDERPTYIDDKEMTWIVLDYVNVIVHIFLKDRREFYGLEKLWGDAKFTHVKDELVLQLNPPSKKTTRKAKASV